MIDASDLQMLYCINMIRGVITALILLVGTVGFCGENYLNSIVLSDNFGVPSVVLRTDEITKVKKSVEQKNRLVLTLKNTKQSDEVNTIYNNLSGTDGLILQNKGNDLNVYIELENASGANVILETPNSSPLKISDGNENKKIMWSLFSVFMFICIGLKIKYTNNNIKLPDINEQIKDREKELYKRFQKEVAILPTMNYKLKSYSKHVLKGETLRSYESRMSKIS